VRGQAVMYLESKKDQEKKQKKEMEKAKKQAVRLVASIMSMSTVLQKGHSLGEDGDSLTQGN